MAERLKLPDDLIQGVGVRLELFLDRMDGVVYSFRNFPVTLFLIFSIDSILIPTQLPELIAAAVIDFSLLDIEHIVLEAFKLKFQLFFLLLKELNHFSDMGFPFDQADIERLIHYQAGKPNHRVLIIEA